MRLVASAALALLLVLAAFFSVYYDRGERGPYSQDWNEEQRQDVTDTLDFLNGNEADIGFYTENEERHLVDVRRLVNACKLLALFLFLLLIAFFLIKRDAGLLRAVLRYGGLGAMLLALLLALLSLLDFSRFWTAFHELLFPQGNWRFPAESTLITLFPERFFEAFAGQVLLAALAYGLVALLAGHSGGERKRSASS